MTQLLMHWKSRWNHSHNSFSCAFSRCATNDPVLGYQEWLFKKKNFFCSSKWCFFSSKQHSYVGRSLEYFEDCYMWEGRSESLEGFSSVLVQINFLDMTLIITLKHSKDEIKYYFDGLQWSKLKSKRLPV